ncbi:FMN-binding protein [Chloroflexota bacterium]
MKRKIKELYPIIFITLVVLLSISLLAFTDNITDEKREWQREQRVTEMLSGMFPDMSRYDLIDEIYLIYNNGDIIGYAYIAQGKGYGGYIDILVGLEDENTIKGINIIKHTESPGLGARIIEDEYRDQYIGLDIADSEMEFNGGQIDSITGATISSKAVADAVRATALEKVKELFGTGGDQDE